MTNDEIERLIDRAERAAARRQDEFECPTDDPESEALIDLATAELNRREFEAHRREQASERAAENGHEAANDAWATRRAMTEPAWAQ